MDLNHKNILVSCCYGLGDLITCTPALRQLKQTYPACHLTVLTNDNHIGAIRGIPYIDEVVGLGRGTRWGRFSLLPVLRRQQGVAFLDWQPQLLLLAWLLRIPLRGGICREGSGLNRLFTYRAANRQQTFREYAGSRRAREISESLGISLAGDMTCCDIAAADAAVRQGVDQLLEASGLRPEQPFLLLSPFAGYRAKYWPEKEAKRFVQLAEQALGMPVLVTGGPGDKPAANRIAARNVAGQLDVPMLVEIVRRAALVVSADSGPMHLAGAAGRPVVALFGTDLPLRWAPRQHCEVIALQLECCPCDGAQMDSCPDFACMAGITADMVLERCLRLVHKQ